jgi:hypothetical protein
LARSLQRELNSFYQRLQASEFSIHFIDKSAFSRSRSKLKPEAFKELMQVSNDSFYAAAPYKTWRGFRLLAIDGSTAVLPNHKTIGEEFGVTKFGPEAASPRSVARFSILYDVLNLTTLDVSIGGYETGERELARNHFSYLKQETDLVLMDRGYPSLRLMYELHLSGRHYCIRIRDDWWLEVRNMLAAGEQDKEVVFELPLKEQTGLPPMPDGSYRFKCRLVAVTLAGNCLEILCTSVLDKERLPCECFSELYHYRWNVEEGYKLYKNRLQLEAFSGKTALAVKQDFFAKAFTMTLMAALAFPVDEKIRTEQPQTKRKHPCKTNKTNALALTSEMMSCFFIKKIVKPALNVIDKILRKTVEIVRPNRSNPRKKIKKKPPAMNYKRL